MKLQNRHVRRLGICVGLYGHTNANREPWMCCSI